MSRLAGNRRQVQRGSITVTDSQHYYGKDHRRDSWVRRTARTRTVEDNRIRSLVPNLLATNRQVRAEANTYLYKQEIIMADTHALQGFLATIGPYNRQLLSSITLRGWTEGADLRRVIQCVT